MSYTVIKNTKKQPRQITHYCTRPDIWAFDPGSIIECDECGKRWKLRLGNYRYWGRPIFKRRGKKK